MLRVLILGIIQYVHDHLFLPVFKKGSKMEWEVLTEVFYPAEVSLSTRFFQLQMTLQLVTCLPGGGGQEGTESSCRSQLNISPL